ncbi:hypothetical protein SAMN06295967_1217 [Belliella buryatensis]|uniref:Uncharacterized protein n=1 Tax=Belliella buryatensis TaxID=1500549 RepID=A0A239GYE4_9BACT|nr:hypothetical protein [Belliella buryatensis]SNS74226.1 hypothetical protein SAMN06295967_1217 [Belliella buryatensis]
MNSNFPNENDVQIGIPESDILKYRNGILGILNQIKIERRHTTDLLDNIKVVYELLSVFEKACENHKNLKFEK